MNALLNVLVLTLGTALAPSAPVAAPGPMVALGAVAPVYRLAPAPAARGGEIPPPSQQATCTAICTEGSNVMCSGSSCTAVNQDCSSGQTGYVQCDGNYTYCATCPQSCTFFQCRQGCSYCRDIGCFPNCISTITCECECICN